MFVIVFTLVWVIIGVVGSSPEQEAEKPASRMPAMPAQSEELSPRGEKTVEDRVGDAYGRSVTGCEEQKGLRTTDGSVYICAVKPTGEEIVASVYDGGTVSQIIEADGTVIRP